MKFVLGIAQGRGKILSTLFSSFLQFLNFLNLFIRGGLHKGCLEQLIEKKAGIRSND